MPKYTLHFIADGKGEAQQIDCSAPDPWLALEKNRHAIGRRTVELREGSRSLGRFHHGFPSGVAVWESSPRV
jgi:hypothetical protein